jgi:hypothetical protein
MVKSGVMRAGDYAAEFDITAQFITDPEGLIPED